MVIPHLYCRGKMRHQQGGEDTRMWGVIISNSLKKEFLPSEVDWEIPKGEGDTFAVTIGNDAWGGRSRP